MRNRPFFVYFACLSLSSPFFMLEKILATIGPDTLCQKLKIALGTAAIGLKCAAASAAPKPEFCMPTSIEMALLSKLFKPKPFAAKKPIK